MTAEQAAVIAAAKRWRAARDGARVAETATDRALRLAVERGEERPNHPTPKPLPLMRELVRLFTDPGDLILDPFAGSGTTGLAARLEGRRAILIEREERHCAVAAERLRDMPSERGGQTVLFGGGR